VAVSLTGRISTTDEAPPPQLRTISIAINRNGRLDYNGLPAGPPDPACVDSGSDAGLSPLDHR
jgi:hypothetical protein